VEIGGIILVKEIIKDEGQLSELLKNILSKKDKVRHNSFKVLLKTSEEQPEVLYYKWDFFANLIDSDNSYLKLIAVRIIANLTLVDRENKFEKIFKKYYALFNDSVIVAGHLAANSGKIAKTKPKLQTKITNKLLSIDKTNQKHKDLVKAYTIEAFDEYFEEAENKKKIIEFVKKQLNSTSPKARKKAKEFLKKRETKN
jgi:hypothetical protein